MNITAIKPNHVKNRHRWVHRAAGFIGVALARLAVRLPKWMLLVQLRIARFFAQILGLGSTCGTQPFDELEDLLKNDPKGFDALRRMVLNGRTAQFRAFLKGVLRHHLCRSPIRPIELTQRSKPRVRSTRPTPLKLAMIGDSYQLNLLARAYERRPHLTLMNLDENGALPADLDGLEVASIGARFEPIITSALDKKITVSVPFGSVTSAEQIDRLWAVADASGTSIRVHHPLLYYPPAQLLSTLIVSGEIGEVCSVRVRATLAGGGSVHEVQPPDRIEYLSHPAFDHFVLLVCLGGLVERVTAYLHPMDPQSGGQGLVACRYRYPGRYGLLDLSYAPQMVIPTAHRPHDLEVEVAGSDGIIWLRRGEARRTQTAPIFVRVGRQAYSIGVESGLQDRWDTVFDASADHFVDMMRDEARDVLRREDLRSALWAKEMAYRDAENREVTGG